MGTWEYGTGINLVEIKFYTNYGFQKRLDFITPYTKNTLSWYVEDGRLYIRGDAMDLAHTYRFSDEDNNLYLDGMFFHQDNFRRKN